MQLAAFRPVPPAHAESADAWRTVGQVLSAARGGGAIDVHLDPLARIANAYAAQDAAASAVAPAAPKPAVSTCNSRLAMDLLGAQGAGVVRLAFGVDLQIAADVGGDRFGVGVQPVSGRAACL